jgi:hypothetical protein
LANLFPESLVALVLRLLSLTVEYEGRAKDLPAATRVMIKSRLRGLAGANRVTLKVPFAMPSFRVAASMI